MPNEEGYATADVESDQLHVPASWPPEAAKLEKSWPPEAARLEGCGRFTGHVQSCLFAVACACTVMSFLQCCDSANMLDVQVTDNLQTWQEASHGQSPNPLKILLLCVCED